MTVINLPGPPGNTLGFDLSRKALRLYEAVGGARMELSLDISRRTKEAPPAPLTISAVLYVGDRNRARRMLTTLHSATVINPSETAVAQRLTGFVTDEQLRLVEANRVDEVPIEVEVTIGGLTGSPAFPFSVQGTLWDSFTAQEWASRLKDVDAATHVELLIPITDDPDRANSARRIREARELIRDGKYEAAFTAARQALEPLMKSQEYKNILKALPTNPKVRDQNQRFVASVQADFSMLSGAVHDDPGVTDDFTWTKQQAVGIVARVAAHLLWPAL